MAAAAAGCTPAWVVYQAPPCADADVLVLLPRQDDGSRAAARAPRLHWLLRYARSALQVRRAAVALARWQAARHEQRTRPQQQRLLNSCVACLSANPALAQAGTSGCQVWTGNSAQGPFFVERGACYGAIVSSRSCMHAKGCSPWATSSMVACRQPSSCAAAHKVTRQTMANVGGTTQGRSGHVLVSCMIK